MHHEIGLLIVVLVSIIGGMLLAAFFVLPQSYRERLATLDNLSKERMLLIEKGMDPSLAEKKKRSGNDPLMWGLLLAGLGLGGFIGYFIAHSYYLNGGIIIHATGFFFGGMALVVYHVIQRRGDKTPK